MNLLMQAPLLDSRGNLRYFIGAQIDVSGLVKDATDLEAFRRMLDEEEGIAPTEESKDEFRELSEMFNHGELDTVRKFGGNMHRDHLETSDDKTNGTQRPRLLIQDQSTFDVESAEKPPPKPEGRLAGPYKHVSLTYSAQASSANIGTVSPRPPRAVPPHSLHIALPPCSWNPPVTFPRPHRRLKSCARVCARCSCRWISRCNSEDPLATARCSGSQHIFRGGQAALDTLHTAARPKRERRHLDGCHHRRGKTRSAK